MCSPKTMLKIGVAIAVPLGIGFVVFPQFRSVIAGLAPLALFALCPLAMLFGVRGISGNNHTHSGDSCPHCGHKQQQKHI